MSKKNKIAFVISSLSSGGAERVVTVLCNTLCQEYDIILITLRQAEPFYELNEKVEIVACSKLFKPKGGLLKSLQFNYVILKGLISILRKRKIQLVIGFMRTSNILAVLASKFLRIPVIISERNHPVVIDRSQSRFWKFLTRLTYPRASKLVIQTETIKNYYLKFVKNNILEIIPNPINPDFGKSNGIEKQNIILNVGSLIPQKAQHHLINAFSRINPPNWTLHIVGEGDRRKELEELVIELGMSNKIKLPGRSQRVEENYKKSKIFAFTSNYEGFPNVLLEAMYFGLACVSTDCPSGPGDILTDEKNGYLIPVGNEIELEKKLRLLIENEPIREKFSANAKQASNKYSISRVKLYWQKLIDQELDA